MIPLGSPQIGEDGIQAVTDALASGTLSVGNRVSAFEAEFSSFAGRQHGVAVASGSVALELALEAVFEDGARIAISPYNCGSVLYSVLRAGLELVFVDADSRTSAVSGEALRRETDVDGILVTHLFGQPADMDDVLDAAAELDATVVEDFAQAPGAEYKTRTTGSFGRAGVCSFGATKNITTAEGGIVITDDDDIAEYVETQRSNTDDVTPPPRSVRLNDIEAEIGLEQLGKYDETIARKRVIAEIYRNNLQGVQLPDVAPGATHVYHAFPVFHEDADGLAAHLEANDIGTNRLYDTLLSEYDAAPLTEKAFPEAERLARETVLLPIHAAVSDEEAAVVAETVNEFCGRKNQ